MTPAQSFQRARQPEQITLRREQLLAAAAELFDAEGPLGAGLNAIAAKAGLMPIENRMRPRLSLVTG